MGKCKWCGEEITDANRQVRKTADEVCGECDKGRTWLLKCIRSSGHAAKYVATREKQYAAGRLSDDALQAFRELMHPNL